MPYPRKELDIVHDKTVTEHGAWFARSLPITREAMLKNVFRFGQMPQSDRAFVDAVIPGHNRVLMGALGRGTVRRKPQAAGRDRGELSHRLHPGCSRATAPRCTPMTPRKPSSA